MDKKEDVVNWVKFGVLKQSESNSIVSKIILTPPQTMTDKSSSTSRRTSSSTRAENSFSNLDEETVFKWLNLHNFNSFIQTQLVFENQFINIISAPNELKDFVFNRLSNDVKSHTYPAGKSELECTSSVFTTSLLNEIVAYVNDQFDPEYKIKKFTHAKKYELVFSNLEFEDYKNFASNIQKTFPVINPVGRPYGVILDENEKLIMAIEIRRDSINDAFKQALLYLKIGFRVNNNDLTVYGLCSDGCDYSVVSFNGTNYKSLYKFSVLFPQMKYSSFKEHWKRQRSSLIVDIIYTILHGNMQAESN